MSVLNGPNEGNWSVFAEKIVKERDALREELDQLRKEAARERAVLLKKLDEAKLGLMERDALRAENECDACGGTGKPVSGIPCMCAGTGKMSRAAITLREEVITLRAEVERLRPYEQAVRESHNGYDPEARKAMAPSLKEPETPKQAIKELIEEAEAPLVKELEAAQQLAINDEKTIQTLRDRLAAAEKLIATVWPAIRDSEREEVQDALAAFDAAKEADNGK